MLSVREEENISLYDWSAPSPSPNPLPKPVCPLQPHYSTVCLITPAVNPRPSLSVTPTISSVTHPDSATTRCSSGRSPGLRRRPHSPAQALVTSLLAGGESSLFPRHVCFCQGFSTNRANSTMRLKILLPPPAAKGLAGEVTPPYPHSLSLGQGAPERVVTSQRQGLHPGCRLRRKRPPSSQETPHSPSATLRSLPFPASAPQAAPITAEALRAPPPGPDNKGAGGPSLRV